MFLKVFEIEIDLNAQIIHVYNCLQSYNQSCFKTEVPEGTFNVSERRIKLKNLLT